MKTMKRKATRYKWSKQPAANLALLSQVKPQDYVAVRMSNGGVARGRATMLPGGPKHGVFFYDLENGRPFSVQHLQDDVDSFYHAPAADSSGADWTATGEDAAGAEEGHDSPLLRNNTFSGDLPDVPQDGLPEKRRKRAETQLSFALSEYEKLDPTGKDYTPLRRSALSEDGFDPDTDEATVTRCLELLKERGIHLEDDTDASNFCARLCTALHALQPDNEQDEAMGGDEDDPSTHFTQRGRSNPDEDVSGMEYLLSLNRLARIREETPVLMALAKRQGRELEAAKRGRIIRRLSR